MDYTFSFKDAENNRHTVTLNPNSTICLEHPNKDVNIGISPYHLFELGFKVIGNRDMEGEIIYPEDPKFVDKASILS